MSKHSQSCRKCGTDVDVIQHGSYAICNNCKEEKSKMSSDDVCDFCKGASSDSTNVCVYCNGTGEWNQAAQSYMQNHICQCIVLDRKFCPVCNKACHHDTSLNPKCTIDPGFGGQSTSISIPEKKEMEIIA